MTQWKETQQQLAAKEWGKQALDKVKAQSKEADRRIAHKKAKTKIRTPYKDNSDVLAMQEKLYNDGYYGDIDYNKAVDGIWGKASQDAYKKFISDNSSFKLSNQPFDRHGNLTRECATYVNGELSRNGIELYGNSYELGSKGLPKVASGYDNLKRPSKVTYNNLARFQQQAADNFANDVDTMHMDPNKVYLANMYYNHGKSTGPGYGNNGIYDYSEEALANGTGSYGTHEGLVYNNGNQWRVTHNIHGTVHDQPLKLNLGSKGNPRYAVTSMYEAPNQTPSQWNSLLRYKNGGLLKKSIERTKWYPRNHSNCN